MRTHNDASGSTAITVPVSIARGLSMASAKPSNYCGHVLPTIDRTTTFAPCTSNVYATPCSASAIRSHIQLTEHAHHAGSSREQCNMRSPRVGMSGSCTAILSRITTFWLTIMNATPPTPCSPLTQIKRGGSKTRGYTRKARVITTQKASLFPEGSTPIPSHSHHRYHHHHHHHHRCLK